LLLFFSAWFSLFIWTIFATGMAVDHAGAREQPEGRAALHLPVAAGVIPAQGARLPLPW